MGAQHAHQFITMQTQNVPKLNSNVTGGTAGPMSKRRNAGRDAGAPGAPRMSVAGSPANSEASSHRTRCSVVTGPVRCAASASRVLTMQKQNVIKFSLSVADVTIFRFVW